MGTEMYGIEAMGKRHRGALAVRATALGYDPVGLAGGQGRGLSCAGLGVGGLVPAPPGKQRGRGRPCPG